MNYLAYFILGVMLLGIVILVVPISLGYNSAEKWFKLTWLGLTITKRLGQEKPEKIGQKTTPKPKKNYGRAIMARFWQKRDLVLQLLPQLWHFGLKVVRTLSFRDSVASFSLPDQMWNGILYGVLTNIHLDEVNLSVNFVQRNYAKIWVTLYPYRVARQLAVLLLHLPYLQMLRFAWDLKNLKKEI